VADSQTRGGAEAPVGQRARLLAANRAGPANPSRATWASLCRVLLTMPRPPNVPLGHSNVQRPTRRAFEAMMLYAPLRACPHVNSSPVALTAIVKHGPQATRTTLHTASAAPSPLHSRVHGALNQHRSYLAAASTSFGYSDVSSSPWPSRPCSPNPCRVLHSVSRMHTPVHIG
jgi:hypothetical protein